MARRTKTEQVEDAFDDLTFAEKTLVARNIASLYRQAEQRANREMAAGLPRQADLISHEEMKRSVNGAQPEREAYAPASAEVRG